MRILVACEFSGRVRDAFLAKGHDALSCDLLASETPGPHYQGDVRDLVGKKWDMMIAFPPCTYLSKICANRWKEPARIPLQQEAMEFVYQLASLGIERIAIENPIGYINSHWRKPDQIIEPWMFGHPLRKATCLWLKNLPPLLATEVCTEKRQWVKNVPGTKHQARIRSLTFQGVADAMAAQWG